MMMSHLTREVNGAEERRAGKVLSEVSSKAVGSSY